MLSSSVTKRNPSLVRQLVLSLISHRTAALFKWDLHFLVVRLRGRWTELRSEIAKQILDSSRPLYLNLGSGPRGLDSPHWLNLDGYADINVHHLVDFSKPLPIASSSIDGVFSEHVLEHFDLETGIELLRECHRVLVPGGRVRIIMPDAEHLVRTYLTEPASLLAHRQVKSEEPMDALNSYFRQRYEHQCLYDFPLAAFALREAGFTDITRVSCGHGDCPKEMILDDPKYGWESVYVEAVKPRADPAEP